MNTEKKGRKNHNQMRDQIVTLDPLSVYFTHSKIRDTFTGCNKTIDQTLQEIRNGTTKITDIPLIKVYTDGQNYFSQNNRRLYLFKTCRSENLLPNNTVQVRLEYLPSNKKYSSQTCSLKTVVSNRK